MDSPMEGVEELASDDFFAGTLQHFKNSERIDNQHLCAVILALSEVIREQGLKPTATAYFAAIMASLERRQAQGSLDVLFATVSLLALVLPKLPQGVLRSKLDASLAVVSEIVSETKGGESGAAQGVVKAGLGCLQTLLQEADHSKWLKLARPFGLSLHYCTDARPKVRKRAHLAVSEVLSSLAGTPSLAAASDSVDAFCDSVLTAATSGAPSESATSAASSAMHLLGGVRSFLPRLSGKASGKLMQRLVSLLALQQPIISRHVIDALDAYASEDADASADAGVLADVLGRVLELSDAEKLSGDESAAVAKLIEKGYAKLFRADPALGAKRLPGAFHALAAGLASEREELIFTTAESLRALINGCIDDAMIRQGLAEGRTGPSEIERVCVCLEGTLGYQYRGAWDMALLVVAEMYQKLGPASYQLMYKTTQTLGELQALEDENMPCRPQLHAAIGAAIEAMGPEQLLSILPLNLDGPDLSKANLWLLPILEKHIVGARLHWFADQVLPLVGTLSQRAAKATAEGRPIAARNAEACATQLWGLLPAVCNYPVDAPDSFKFLAKHLGTAFNDRPELRGVISSSLQHLIKQSKQARDAPAGGADASDSETPLSASVRRARAFYTPTVGAANLAAITAFTRNFLPLFFNAFVASPPEKRAGIFAAVEAFASVADPAQVRTFAETMMVKLLEATRDAEAQKGGAKTPGEAAPMNVDGSPAATPTARRCTFMELAVALTPGMDDVSVGALYRAARPAVMDPEAPVQKKAYKLLARLCELRPAFLRAQGADLFELLMTSQAGCASAARRARLACLRHVVVLMTTEGAAEKDEAISALVSEIIIATKEVNAKTRNAAYELLVTIARAAENPELGGSQEALVRFFGVIVGGLAGRTPHMISASVVALARLLYEFSTTLSHTIPDLLPSVLLLLRTKSREVIKSVLGFVKVVIARLPADDLVPHLPDLVEGLLIWAEDSKNHFKMKIKVIFERLVRRCGYEAVAAVTPPAHQKLITNIRKTRDRLERKKRESEVGSVKSGAESARGGAESVRSKALTRAATARRSEWSHGDVFSDDDEEGFGGLSDDGATTVGGAPGDGVSRGGTLATRAARKARKVRSRLPEEDESGPLDLLDVQRTRRLMSAPGGGRRGEEEEGGFEEDPEGRLIIEEEKKGRKRRRDGDEMELDDDDYIGSQSGKSNARSRKGGDARGGKAKGESKVNLSNKARKLQDGKRGFAMGGEEYRAGKGKGGGDARGKKKLEPFAYWPLDPKMLNRREGKRADARKGMADVLKTGRKKRGVGVDKKRSGIKKGHKAHKRK